MKRIITSLTVLAVIACLPSMAGADALPLPPRDCPEGAVGRSSRLGAWCTPTECRSDAQCGRTFSGTTRCSDEPISFCVLSETRTNVRFVGRDQVRRETRGEVHTVVGPCGANETCEGDAVCQTARRCVPAARAEGDTAGRNPLAAAIEAAVAEAPASESPAAERSTPVESSAEPVSPSSADESAQVEFVS